MALFLHPVFPERPRILLSWKGSFAKSIAANPVFVKQLLVREPGGMLSPAESTCACEHEDCHRRAEAEISVLVGRGRWIAMGLCIPHLLSEHGIFSPYSPEPISSISVRGREVEACSMAARVGKPNGEAVANWCVLTRNVIVRETLEVSMPQDIALAVIGYLEGTWLEQS